MVQSQKDAQGHVSPLRVRNSGVSPPGPDFGSVLGHRKRTFLMHSKKDAQGAVSALRVRIAGVSPPGPDFGSVLGLLKIMERSVRVLTRYLVGTLTRNAQPES